MNTNQAWELGPHLRGAIPREGFAALNEKRPAKFGVAA